MPLDELDGVTIAPDIHKVVFENDEVRVLEITIPAGTTTPLHTHLVPTVTYRISGSDFVRRDEHGNTMFDSRADPHAAAPRVSFSRSTPRHTIENTGGEDLVVIGVELKQRGA